MKHTQGEWEMSEGSDFVTATNGDIICQFFTKDEGSMLNKEANAKLIAGAPELLEVVSHIEMLISNEQPIDSNTIAMISNAIQKATL